jgi:predicted component of viral defense system (DUF524 family)
MTKLLEKAFQETQKLPDEEQDRFAQWLLAELEDEIRWEKQFARSEGALRQLAEEALAETRAGKASSQTPDQRV